MFFKLTVVAKSCKILTDLLWILLSEVILNIKSDHSQGALKRFIIIVSTLKI
jgi:hypothetical protein